MSCVAVATSPALAVCHSPSRRHCDDPGLFGDVRSTSHLVTSLDLLPSSPLLYATPKLSPFSSPCKPSPSHSSMPPPPSPRVQCPSRASSWTSPLGTPSGRTTTCHCGGVHSLTSCPCSSSCNRPSASPSDPKWKTSLERRFSADGLLDGKYGVVNIPNVEPPSPRLTSPGSRYSRAMSPYSSAIEPPSPRFGGHSLFVSPRPIARSGSAKMKLQPNVADECVHLPGNASAYSGAPAFLGPSWMSSAEDVLRLDSPQDREDIAAEPLCSPKVGTGDVASLNTRPSTPPLKRKRPPRLEIPTSANLVVPANGPHVVELGEEALNEMTVEGSYYGVSCKKGRRETLEDTQRAIPDLRGDPGQAFFGVFDGHGGRKAADFAAENLARKIVEAMEGSDDGDIEAAVRTGYLTTDAEFLEKRVNSGASCVTAIIKDGCMVVANAGDCRAVLSRGGNAEAVTSDHRAGREDERERIEGLGGYVDDSTGTWRVQGTLAVSRGIGDLHLKEWISAEPEVQKLRITPDCEFLILASDGLWDAVSNQEAVDIARVLLQSEHVEAAVMDMQIPLAMASSSLSKEVDEEATNSRVCQETQARDMNSECPNVVPSEYSAEPLSCIEDDELDICAGTLDAEMPVVSFPEPPPPTVGPVAACKKLVETSVKRGCHDDITVMIVDLQYFLRKPVVFTPAAAL